MKFFFPLLWICFAMISFTVKAMDFAYTSLEEKSCKMLNSNAQEDYFSMSCPGRDGYEVNISGGDNRSWLQLVKQGQEVYNSMNDINAHTKGQFPYISGKVLEWRYDNAKNLVALIVRVNSQDANNPEKSISELFVFGYDGKHFCYLGTNKTNEDARKMANTKGVCKL